MRRSRRLRRAGDAARGATLYVTLEPCSHYGKSPPCADAVIAAGISRVVSAMEDPNPEVAGAGHARLRAAGIAVDVGLGAEEARHDHAGHIRRMRDGRPARHAQARGVSRRQSRRGRAPAGRHHRRGGAGPRSSHARRKRCHHGWDRHRAGGRPDAHLPLARHGEELAGAHRPRQSLRLPLGSRLVRSAREVPVWASPECAPPHASEEALRRTASRCCERRQSAARLDLKDGLECLPPRASPG